MSLNNLKKYRDINIITSKKSFSVRTKHYTTKIFFENLLPIKMKNQIY